MSQDTVGSQGRRQLAMYGPVLYFLLINRDDGLAGFFAPGGTRTHDRTMFVVSASPLRHVRGDPRKKEEEVQITFFSKRKSERRGRGARESVLVFGSGLVLFIIYSYTCSTYI